VIEITPNMRVLVAIAPVDFRRRIDGLSKITRSILNSNPFDGTVYVFRNRASTYIALLKYDGQGFWLAQKRLSAGKFRYWPRGTRLDAASKALLAQELHTLIWAGDPATGAPGAMWRPLPPEPEGPRAQWVPPPRSAEMSSSSACR